LAGLAGSGRSELADTIFGLTPADAGEIRISGRTTQVNDPAAAMQAGVAYVPKDRRRHGVIGEMSIAENTTLACLGAVARGGLIQSGLERSAADRFMTRFRIKAPSSSARVGTLSGGNQQKVSLARWLMTEPRVLVLDEPTQGVDVGAKAEIHGFIMEMAERGLAILLISSELPELLGMCDRVAVMCEGRIAGELPAASATAPALLALALGH
jgi:rhamnose transport system ATP-binding protein